MYRNRLLILFIFTVGVGGCENTTQSENVEIIVEQQTLSSTENESIKIQVYEPVEEIASEDSGVNSAADSENLQEGEFSVSIDDRKVVINARKAPRQKILLDLASKLQITLRMSEEVRELIDLENFNGDTIEAIGTLLDGMAYSIDYVDRSPSSLPQINAISVGHLAQSFAGNKSEGVLPYSGDDGELASDMALGFPYMGEEAITLAQKVSDIFEYGSVEEQLTLVNEIELTSAGVRILSDQLQNNINPEVRVEIINALSNSDAFAAKWMTLNGLKDGDKSVIMASLESIEIWQDPSSLPYVEAVLQRTTDSEIVELAESIIEYNSDLDTVSFVNQSPQEAEQAAREVKIRAQQTYKQQKVRNQMRQQNMDLRRGAVLSQ